MSDVATPPAVVLVSDAGAADTGALVDALSLAERRIAVASSPTQFPSKVHLPFAPIPAAPDAAIEQAITGILDAAVGSERRLDGLVLVLAPPPPVSSLVECSLSDWQRSFEARLRRVFLITRHALQAMLEAGAGGSIVIVGPEDSNVGDAAESASAEALRALTRSLAKEYGRRQIRTNLVETASPGRAADLVAWLLSPGASFVDGDILQAEGQA